MIPAELCFACDVLQLPGMVVSLDAKPIFHGMFNQIKQEYVFARYQYYSALQEASKPHFADKDTHLINFADYPQYGMRIEQLKSSFKTLFGLLDKMAYAYCKRSNYMLDHVCPCGGKIPKKGKRGPARYAHATHGV